MIKIERVRSEEIGEVKALLSHTWVDTYSSFLSKSTIKKVTSVWHDPKRLLEQAQNPDVFFGIAKKDGGKIVGLVTVSKLDDITIMMYRLYVHPQQQRKDIGKMLLDETLKHFPHAKKLRLEVEEKNEKGLSFYKKQGFQFIEKKQDKVEDEILDVIVMEKMLN